MYNKMEKEFTIILQISPNKWCDLLDACDATRVWDNTNLRKCKVSCVERNFVLVTEHPDNPRESYRIDMCPRFYT